MRLFYNRFMPTPILATKLYIPPLRPKVILRLRLIEQLNNGLHRKLTLISAPAGFGKTTLVVDWVQNLRLTRVNQIAWLSLDESDNNLTRFLTYFIAALNQIEAKEIPFGNTVLGLLQSPQPPPLNTLLISLINEIATIPDKIIFILDDYHLIEDQSIHDALSFFVDNMPPQIHLVIATREDPFLSLARLRAHSQLTELRAADLRFTSAEAADFLNEAMGLALSVEDITALERRTEGWIVGLQLAAISLQGHADTSSLIQSFTGSHRLVLDYLIEDVLNQQPANIQNFLLQTAVLKQLTASLCDAATGQEDSQAILEMLDRANLFIIPLDNERQWYRYHHLFAGMLQTRLKAQQPDQIPSLHRRASEWFEQEGKSSDAIRHALAAQDYERAADLAELAWPAWSESIESLTWLGWVMALPDELVRRRPVLSVAYAQALLNVGQLEAAKAKLRDVERCLEQLEGSTQAMIVVDDTQFQVLPATLATTRAYYAQAIGNVDDAIKYVNQALDLLPKDDYYNRAAVTGLLGLAYWASGDVESAYEIFSKYLFQNVPDLIKGTFVLADMKMTLGQLHEAKRTCEHGLRLAKAYDEPNPVGTEDIYSCISEIHREQGDLETAVQDLQTCKNLGEHIELPDWQHRWCIAQSRLEASLGNLDSALNFLDEASRVYVRTPVPETHPIAAMKARLWIKQGWLTEALTWVRDRGLSVDDNLSYMRDFEHITFAKLLVAQHKQDQLDESIHDAIGLLERLLKTAEADGRMGSVIEILVVQALAFEAQGNISAALVSLERALMLAEPEGYCRLFIDEGPPMARLLREALSRGIAPNYVRHLLAAFPDDAPQKAKPSDFQLLDSELIDPLSERELEILQLIAEGLTNPEIAAELYLSLNTVKVHTRNIYSKLDTHSRTQTVARARDLQILPS